MGYHGNGLQIIMFQSDMFIPLGKVTPKRLGHDGITEGLLQTQETLALLT